MTALLTAAPLAFIVGVVVGLGMCSRWRIVRRPQPKDDDDG